MTQLREYILSVVCMSVICAGIQAFFDKDTGTKGAIQLALGVIMTVTVLSPVLRVDLSAWPAYFEDLAAWRTDAVYEGEASAAEAITERITEQSQAYILDKAAALGAQVHVAVRLSDDPLPVPVEVTVRGTVSPYVKQQLKAVIASELGIPEERQLWM